MSRRLGQGILLHDSLEVNIRNTCIGYSVGCKEIRFRWELSGNPLPFRICVDFGNNFGDLQYVLAQWYLNNRLGTETEFIQIRGVKVIIRAPAGEEQRSVQHVVSATTRYNTCEFLIHFVVCSNNTGIVKRLRR
jgi:hypothetical protein